MTMLEAALEFAAQGLPVFPCLPMQKRPATAHGFLDATTDVDVITAWWTERPDYNLAAPTGILMDVIDLDGLEGMNAIEVWAEGKPDVIRYIQPTVITPRGVHIYVPVSGIPNKVGWLPHCDWRGKGGYVLLAGSRTEHGVYQWA